MTSILTNEEKAQIINSHKKNLAMNKYNLELSILEEDAKDTPDSSALLLLNTQMSGIDKQIAALDLELDKLQ